MYCHTKVSKGSKLVPGVQVHMHNSWNVDTESSFGFAFATYVATILELSSHQRYFYSLWLVLQHVPDWFSLNIALLTQALLLPALVPSHKSAV